MPTVMQLLLGGGDSGDSSSSENGGKELLVANLIASLSGITPSSGGMALGRYRCFMLTWTVSWRL